MIVLHRQIEERLWTLNRAQNLLISSLLKDQVKGFTPFMNPEAGFSLVINRSNSLLNWSRGPFAALNDRTVEPSDVPIVQIPLDLLA